MDSITWLVTALALATGALVLSSVGNEIRRRRKFKRYCEKRSSANSGRRALPSLCGHRWLWESAT
jgi:hypothetical protein